MLLGDLERSASTYVIELESVEGHQHLETELDKEGVKLRLSVEPNSNRTHLLDRAQPNPDLGYCPIRPRT